MAAPWPCRRDGPKRDSLSEHLRLPVAIPAALQYGRTAAAISQRTDMGAVDPGNVG
jgi:hypothetical protein